MILPPRYLCVYCREAVNLESKNVMTLVTGWLTNVKSRTVGHITEKHHQYCHLVCLEQEMTKGKVQEDTLF